MVLKTNSKERRAIKKLITESIRETSGVFSYKYDERPRLEMKIIKEITLGKKTPKVGASLGCPHCN